MKTRYWIIILVIVAVVVIGIVLFMYGYLPRPFVHGGKYRAINQYEVFRDLLITILTIAGLFIALLGVTAYKLISKNLGTKVEEGIKTFDTKVKESIASLKTTVTEIVNEQVNYAMATFFLELSYDCWEAYEVKGKFKKDKKDQLEKAIRLSKKALRRAQRLDTEQKQFKKILCSIKNSVAYHLAVRDCDKDAPKAISLAKDAYNERNDFDFEVSCHWMETYGFVLIRMGNKEQKAQGRKIIKGLRDRRYIPKTTLDTIEGKYTENLAVRVVWI